jgi:potassium channel subfamily K, other eukaryote
VPTMTVLIGNMGDTVVRAVQEMTDWTGKKTRVLPEYRVEDQLSSDSDSTRQSPTPASAAPSVSADQTHNYLGLSSVSSPAGEGQEGPAVSPLASSFDEEEKPHASARQKSLQSKRESSASRVQARAEAALLAREISKLAKDVCEQPPKKYRWEEWVIWLNILKEMELEKKIQVSMNLPETNLVEQAHQNKPYRRYHSQPSPYLKRKDGFGWDWTWLHDRGPLFSPQTEAEWILSKLCSRLEHLMSNV